MKIQSQKIVVTGGAGFIGSHLVEELTRENNDITVIDITYDPKSYFVKSGLQKKVNSQVVDIRSKEQVFSFFEKEKPTIVFHLAAEPIVSSAFDNPIDTFQTNIMGTAYILEACRNIRNLQGIIVASSDKAYGKTTKKYSESSPLKGDHPYDVSKSATDLISQTYYKTYGLPVVITRFGNVYGPGDLHMDRIVPGIYEAIIKNKPLLIRSDGKYVRDYVYVKDVVDGYLFLAKNFEKLKGEAFNFSSNDTYSVLDLIKKSEKILDKKIDYKILNTAKNEIPYQHLDDTKIRKLGWRNNCNFQKGLKKSFEWYKQMLSASSSTILPELQA